MKLGAVILIAAGWAPALLAADPAVAPWPGFRGLAAGGVGEGKTPTSWNVPAGDGVSWKTAIPGLGHSSPVVTRDLVCVTTAISGRPDATLRVGLYGDIAPVVDDTVHQFQVHCLDRKTGVPRFATTAASGVPKVKRHTKSTHASSTLAADATHLVALFGSEGLYAYDHKGKLLWKQDLGILDSGFFRVPDAQWGFASSPVIVGDKVIVQADVQKDSFLAAFDLGSGRELWRTPRSDVPTWSTPTVHEQEGKPRIVVNGWKHVGGYDLSTGKEIWRMTGGGDIPVPTPVVYDGLVYITNAHGGAAPIFAVRAGASGDITLAAGQTANDAIAWSQPRDGGYMQTPLVVLGLLYVCRDNGVLGVYDAKTGQRIYQERLGDGNTGFTASPVSADAKVYFTSEEGEVVVLKAGPEFQVLARNPLGEIAMATPAIAEGVMYFRTRGHLLALKPGR